MVKRGDLGDHPAYADARQVRGPVVSAPASAAASAARSRSVYAGASGSVVVDAPLSRRSYRTT